MDTSAINKSCENESGQHNLKRKRDKLHSNQTKSSNIQTTMKDEKKSKLLSKNNKISSPTKLMKQSRKRKFVFPEDETIVAKKNRKFYFLNDTVTKPRQHKLNNNNDTINNDKNNKLDSLPSVNITNGKLFKKHKLHFSVTDKNGNCYLVHKNYMKNDLFCSDETKYNYDIFKRTDLNFHIIDEVALEGLDGITIEALWKRLKRVFSNNFSKTMAEKVWKIICSTKQISFYVLEQPRDELVFYDRTKCMDLDNGLYVDPFLDYKDIYPIATVSDAKVKGSCSTFNTRKENNSIRRLTLDKVQESYGQKLVLVADQILRNKSLIYEEADPTIEFVDVEYCLLERIGRARYDGELTHGKISLQSIQNDSRTLYHNKKVLMDNHLTTHQFFYLKSYVTHQNISGGLMHLTRFYNRHRNKQLIIMERLANYLRDKPKNQVKFTEFRQIFGRSQPIVKLQKTADFQRFFKILVFPYRALYPNAPKHEWLAKSRRKERTVRIIKLIDPHVNIAAIMDSKDSFQVKRETAITSPGCKFINYEHLRDVYWYIAKAGHNGVTLHEIHEYFKVDFYSLRTTVKKLMTRNVIYSQKIDLGRQQSFKFIAKYLKYPQIKINLTPKQYELDNYTIMRILKGYEKPVDNKAIQIYNEPDVSIETPNDSTSFTIKFDNFTCNVFLNDFLDPTLDELNIYDIINKGRDRLLLAQSNLLKTYCGEWENFHLTEPNFLKFSNIFTNGFGRIIYDYLNTLILANNIEIDNKIIFNLENFIKDVRYRCILPNITKRSYNFTNTCRYFYNDCYYEDLIGKLYLFECLFNENHTNRDVLPQFKDIVKRVGYGEGKRSQQSPNEPQECVKDKVELQVINNVVMEKFMGNQPIKVYETHCNEENVNIEIFQSTPSTLKRKNYQYYEVTNDKCLTQRFIDRTNLILKTINEQKIIKEIYELPRLVREHENLQGYDKTVCRKSINTIVQRLIEEGYIKVYKVIIKNEKQTKGQTFVCALDVNYDHPIITGTLEEIKMKFHIITTKINQLTTIQVRKQKLSPFSFNDVKTSINELKQLTSSRLEVLYKYNKNAGYKYGYSPKFVRMRILHEFLFYLIYEQNQQLHQLNKQEIYELCKNYKIQLRKNDLNSLPSVYCKEISWKMFVPSLPNHQNWPQGWALICDIILRLPLSVFVKLFNICYNIPELEGLLNHPIKRHFLLKHIDNNIKNVLLLKRKYLYHVYDTICNMCYIGLIQLGPKSSKEKDQIFIYLNRKASLLDTTTSEPGYNQIEDKQYKKLCFKFKTISNVEFYWSEMWRICLNTRLGKRKIMEGQFVTIEDCLIKQQMIDTLKQKTPQTALLNDNGDIPGDHKGAAGLDSALWSYVKRNWSWNIQQKPKQLQEQQSQQIDSLKNEKLEITLPKPIQYDLLNTKNLQQKVYLTPKSKQNKINTISKLNVKKRCKILRKITPRKNRIREYYDNIDKAIMKKNRQIRVEWDDNEDFYLRFLRVASLFLCPLFKRQMITYTVIRDVLHRICPKSRNKTSKAIQRRLCLLLATDEILRIMETNVENFLNSEIIAKYFGQIHNRYQSGHKYTDAQITIAYIYFLSYIKRHSKEIELLLLGYIATVDFFSHPYISLFELILDNVESNERMYQQPQTINDIKIDTIKTIIHCSINCKLNPKYGYQLFQIYREYSDDLIKNSINQLKKHQFLTLNKRQNEKNFTANWHIPLKFSYLFTTMKTSTYPLMLYQEVYENFQLLLNNSNEYNFLTINELNTIWQQFEFNFDIPERGIVLNPNIDDHSEIIEEISKRFHLYLKRIAEENSEINESHTTETNNQNNNHNIEDIKKRVIKLIFRVPYLIEGNLENYVKKLNDSQSTLEINNYLYLMIIDLKRFALDNCLSLKLKEFIKEISDNETIIDNLTILLENLSKIVFSIQNLCVDDDCDDFGSKFKQWQKDEELNFNDDNENNTTNDNNNKIIETRKLQFTNKSMNNALDKCIKNALNGEIPSIDEIKIGIIEDLNNENRQIPHITDLTQFLIKERLENDDDIDDYDNIEQIKEHFIIKYPKLNHFEIINLNEFKNLQPIQELVQRTTRMKLQKYLHDLNRVKSPQLEKIVEYVRNLNGNDDDIDYVKNLINFIANKKQFGANGDELKQNFLNKSTLCLIKLLNFLCNINIILRTGITQIVYVHYDYQSDWLVKTFNMPPEEQLDAESLKIDMKKKLKASDILQAKFAPWSKLDGIINEELLQEWLSLILSKCFDCPNITFTKLCEHFCFVKPVDLYFLLEVLQEIKCIEICVYNQVGNNIFTTRTIITDKPATCLDNFDEIFIKTKGISGLYFGSFIYNNSDSIEC